MITIHLRYQELNNNADIVMKKFPVFTQLDSMDCGPTCLRMIAKYYGKDYSLQTLRDYSAIGREGVSLGGIDRAARTIGFDTLACKISLQQLNEEAVLPCILHWNQSHFVVLPPQDFNFEKNKKIKVIDPDHGVLKINLELFTSSWIGGQGTGISLLLEPSDSFTEIEGERTSKNSFSFLLNYLRPHRPYTLQLFLGMLAASFLSLIFPFLTQSLVDYGISQKNLSFVYLILAGQLFIFLGNTAINAIRGWIVLHMSSRINISIISDFLVKLMNLPISFFDTKLIGDINQRISDHRRIEQFLTGDSVSILFSMINMIIFSIVIWIYSVKIFILFLAGTIISIAWIMFFMKKRGELDYVKFKLLAENQNSIVEIITGMQEIKIGGTETLNRWEWEGIQAKLFKTNIKSLSLEQLQTLGSSSISQLKNILITFVAVKEVINGEISLGIMLSISFIIGQMSAPIEQVLVFLKSAQDARISFERMEEIHSRENEEKSSEIIPDRQKLFSSTDAEILLRDISFSYQGSKDHKILTGLNLSIPFGKVTAIVGASGSGKTTLMKLLLKFYEPQQGYITLNQISLTDVSPGWWRQCCGVVMADGFIFSNSIARNIAGSDDFDIDRLLHAAKIANIDEYISSLPLGFSTKIGNSGNGISSGQKQRILIARAVYKNPYFIFLDEATSTLDANNEKSIIENLSQFFIGKTVVIIAHRLSTVKHADQIVVMNSGRIVESGNHNSLIEQKGSYYELVRNQLELGS